MSHILGKNDGLFNPSLKFAFKNITDEVFTSYWNGQPIVVKPGQEVSLPHHLADKLTNELVDKIMITAVKVNEVNYYKNNPNTAPNFYRAPSSLGVPAARRVWEDQIVRQLAVDEESPEIQIIRAQIKDELTQDLNREVSREAPPMPSLGEFADIDNVIEKTPAVGMSTAMPTLALKKPTKKALKPDAVTNPPTA